MDFEVDLKLPTVYPKGRRLHALGGNLGASRLSSIRSLISQNYATDQAEPNSLLHGTKVEEKEKSTSYWKSCDLTVLCIWNLPKRSAETVVVHDSWK